MKILITGGAGYIGSAAAHQAIREGMELIIIDNLCKGLKELIPKEATFYEENLCNSQKIEDILIQEKPDAIMHFAAHKSVEESMIDAKKYSENMTGTISLLNAMVSAKVSKIIFSSTAAVYGLPNEDEATEETPTNPINYYGFTKLEMEKIMSWYEKVHGIKYIALRYFNVAGDAGLKYIDPDAKNIFPIIMDTIKGKRKEITIFGDDYNTVDGTGVRDYIHIKDLVQAHFLALQSKYSGHLNLGSGTGYSVKEVIQAFSTEIGEEIPCKIGPRRKGDPAKLIANAKKAEKVLGWERKCDLKDMVSSTIKSYE